MEGRILHRATEGMAIFRDDHGGSVFFTYPSNLHCINPQVGDEVLDVAYKLDANWFGPKANQNQVRFEFSRYMFLNRKVWNARTTVAEEWNLILNDKVLHVGIVYKEDQENIALKMLSKTSLKVTAPKSINDQDIFNFLLRRPNWQVIKSKFFGLHVNRLFEVNQDDIYDAFLLSILRSEIEELVEKYCKKINYDHNEIVINILDAKVITDHGCSACCNKQHKYMNFARELVYASKDYLEETVAHEVCHLVHDHHEESFWELMKSIYGAQDPYATANVHFAMDVRVNLNWDLSVLKPAPVMQQFKLTYDKEDGSYAMFDLSADATKKLPSNRICENGGLMFYGNTLIGDDELIGDSANDTGLVIKDFPNIHDAYRAKKRFITLNNERLEIYFSCAYPISGRSRVISRLML